MSLVDIQIISGYIAGLCFAFSALPQAIKCIRQKHAYGLSTGTLVLWIIGEVCAIVFTLHLWRQTLPLFINYFLNLVFLAPVLYYKFFPKMGMSEKAFAELINE